MLREGAKFMEYSGRVPKYDKNFFGLRTIFEKNHEAKTFFKKNYDRPKLFHSKKNFSKTDKNSADITAENLARCRKLCPPKILSAEYICPPNFCP